MENFNFEHFETDKLDGFGTAAKVMATYSRNDARWLLGAVSCIYLYFGCGFVSMCLTNEIDNL